MPVFNLIYFILFSNFIGISFVYLSIFLSVMSVLMSLFIFFTVNQEHYIYYVKIFDISDYFDFFLSLDFIFDELSCIMLFIVLFISFFVLSFSKWYMKADPYFLKFFYYLNFFIFFMIILVLSNNVILIFVGWEGIGIFSYLLINFWNTRLEANRSSLKAIIFNKIGDCFFYLFIVFFYFVFETFNIYLSKNLISNYLFININFFNFSFNIITLLSFTLILAAVAKSAQLFLHVWLPDAMEGPTPVSALLHAATMVTAGVYLLLKFSWILQHSLVMLLFIMFIGIFTNLFASITAIFQLDIKKIIAYSTASQLGLIFIALSLTKFSLALFHIFTHAFFKALLFLVAGIIIHYCKNKQDLRVLKNFNNFILLLIYVSFLIGSLTLATLPFFSAYYSKDFFIQISLLNIDYLNYFSFFFLNLSVFTTIIYTFKILDYIFWNKKINNFNFNFVIENKLFFFSIYILLFFSFLSGFFFVNIYKFDFLIFSDIFFFNLNHKNSSIITYFEYTNIFIITLMLAGFIIGYYFQIFINIFNLFFNIFFYNIYHYFYKKWLFDNIYYFFFNLFFNFFNNFYLFIDRTLVELNLNSVYYLLKKNSLKIIFLENYLNIFFIFFFIFFLFCCWIWKFFFLIIIVMFFIKYF